MTVDRNWPSRSNQEIAWLTVASRAAACGSCGVAIGRGEPLVYRRRPRLLVCFDCAQAQSVETIESVAYSKREKRAISAGSAVTMQDMTTDIFATTNPEALTDAARVLSAWRGREVTLTAFVGEPGVRTRTYLAEGVLHAGMRDGALHLYVNPADNVPAWSPVIGTDALAFTVSGDPARDAEISLDFGIGGKYVIALLTDDQRETLYP